MRANRKSTTQVWTNIQGIYQKQNKIRKSTVNGATDVAIKIHHESESIILVEGTGLEHPKPALCGLVVTYLQSEVPRLWEAIGFGWKGWYGSWRGKHLIQQ